MRAFEGGVFCSESMPVKATVIYCVWTELVTVKHFTAENRGQNEKLQWIFFKNLSTRSAKPWHSHASYSFCVKEGMEGKGLHFQCDNNWTFLTMIIWRCRWRRCKEVWLEGSVEEWESNLWQGGNPAGLLGNDLRSPQDFQVRPTLERSVRVRQKSSLWWRYCNGT